MRKKITRILKLLLFAVTIAAMKVFLPLCDPASAADYPLDELDKGELQVTVDVLKASGKLTKSSRFALITLHEPSKEEVLHFTPGSELHREALAVVCELGSDQAAEAIVDVHNRRLLSWNGITVAQPPSLDEENDMVEGIVRADPKWQEAMRKRGITDFKDVEIESVDPGDFVGMENLGKRVRVANFNYRGNPKDNMDRSIEGVLACVDLSTKKIVKLIDTGVVPIPVGTPGFDDQSIGPTRQAPKPLEITQPLGASFEVRGHEVRWQGWRFRFEMNPREGLVLSTVRYDDHGRSRSILYRASLSEMVVPYGDPADGWYIRNFFDEGQDGLGHAAVPLEPGTEAPLNAQFFTAVFADQKGVPFEIPRAVALYERDGGLLWEHYDPNHKINRARRARELVLGWIATAGNYDYGFNWIFHQDGVLEMKVLLAGYMETKVVKAAFPGDDDPQTRYGTVVGPHIVAVNHQHFFNFRLDMDIDGATPNSVMEIDAGPAPPGPENPAHNAFMMKKSMLRDELQARRRMDLASSRSWMVFNPSIKNSWGQPVGYMLEPGDNTVPYAAPDSWVRKRAAFTNYHLWVTPYDGSQLFAAGSYIHGKRDDGLGNWTALNRTIENRDVVLWYTLGLTHLPSPEEWPIMDVKEIGFKLVPCGFFDRNPALDVPKP